MKEQSYKLDIVIPCYNEEENIPHTLPKLIHYLDNLLDHSDLKLKDYKLILIDDGSKDNTWKIIEKFCSNHKAIGIKLSRNCGHQNAMLAGLSNSTAEAVLTIDSDLQDDINAIKEMLLSYQNGCDLSLGVRSSRGKDSFFKKHTAKWYYKFLNIMGVNTIEDHADFRLISKRALNALLQHEEVNLFFRGLITEIGFKTDIIYYTRQSREHGKTKYTLKKMLSLAVNGITSFSTIPLRIVTMLGLLLSLLSIGLTIWVVVTRLYGNYSIGWASTLIPILFFGGIQLFCLGIVGEYVGKIYLEVKKRPRFIIETSTDKSIDENH